jgi:tetratricopeptide (TPR) repeat protein
MTGRVTTLMLAALAGASGGLLARAVGSEPPPVRAPAVVRPVEALPLRIERALGDLERRLARLEDAGRNGEAENEEQTEIELSRPAARAETDPRSGRGAAADVLGRPLTHDRADAFFQRLAATPGEIEDSISRLLDAIRDDPRNADLYCALATAYGAKAAFDTPPGPRQGLVWAKAGRAYGEAIRLDPEHWQARYGKAFGESMAPEFLGLRPRAIRQFEELMEIQERRASAAEHVLVYLRLGTLYKDAGNLEKARETWERGRVRFPDDERLGEVLELIAQD